MLVVFGATGNTGGAAARALAKRGQQIRAVARCAAPLRSLVEAGAEAATANLEDAASTTAALAGARAAYVLIPPNFLVDDFRGYQQRVTGALEQALRSASLQSVALLSSLGAEHQSGTGPIVGLHELEQTLRQVPNLNVLSIRAGYFMENFLMNVEQVRATGVLGSPAPAHAPLALIAAADIGEYAAVRLSALDFGGFEVVNLIGPELLTMSQVAHALGAATGQPDLPYVQASYREAEQQLVGAGVRPQLAALYLELYRGAAAGLLQPEAGTPVVHTSSDFAQFARVFGVAYRSAVAS
jgi:uncharacterized protein YbjT (DUF2867 family)